MRISLVLTLLGVSTLSLASDNVAEDLARMGFSSAGGTPKTPVKSESAEHAEVKAPVAEKAAESQTPQAEPMPIAAAKGSESSSGLPKTPYRVGDQETTTTPTKTVDTPSPSSSSHPSAAPQPKGLEDELARMGFSKSP